MVVPIFIFLLIQDLYPFPFVFNFFCCVVLVVVASNTTEKEKKEGGGAKATSMPSRMSK